MHITTPITQANSQLTTASHHPILPLHLKKVILKKRDAENQQNTLNLLPLSSQLMRLVDACGDCV